MFGGFIFDAIDPSCGATGIPFCGNRTSVLRQVNGRWLSLVLEPDSTTGAFGFAREPIGLFYNFTSVDCSGPRYTDTSIVLLMFPDRGRIFGDVLVYPIGPPQIRTTYSQLSGSVCFAFPNPSTSSVREVATVDISSWGLVPPFSIQAQ